MPVNFQEIRLQIKEMGRQAPEREQKLKSKRQLAQELLQTNASRLPELCALVEQATAGNRGLRCAMPVTETLTHTTPDPPLPLPLTLLSADGSQINPDRHAAVEFGVINVGAIRLLAGSAQAPKEITQSTLLFGDALCTAAGGPLTEEYVALLRDLYERKLLMELATKEPLPVVTLTDGPLELFREPNEAPEFQKLFQEYQDVLYKLAELGVVTAGYVDKPRADLVVRLLELVMPGIELEQVMRTRPLRWVTDWDLFHQRLAPGERSAVFAIQSSSSRHFKGALALHFFYLNVGRPEHPWLARVEMPAWVAEVAGLLDLLHAALVIQCQQMGSHPYPYALHRAHEVALVSYAEKQQLENMIAAEYLRLGIPAGERSQKQTVKDLSGSRTRYTR